ncbi:MAG: GTP 3',8-cyclase MoaA [Planctomycetaceae bacterium]|nr:GTP 3',8-cyclase MoaA [Planctomycetaceae bacterium]
MSSLPLVDHFGRAHTNLRISVTDRCNLRCFYCMPIEDVHYLPRAELLSFEEITRLARLLASRCGVHKIRVTGGEPLVRQDLPLLIRQLKQIPGLDDLALTTNGILLDRFAEPLYQAGLRRINISLDTLDATRFQQIARRDSLERVLDGIQLARAIGFEPIKINAVAIRGLTEADILPLANLARETGIEVRFIEYMPLDADQAWEREKVLPAATLRRILAEEFGPLIPEPGRDPQLPASTYCFADGRGRVGFIASVSEPFCGSCNRFRLTADGKLRNCLFSLEETDLRDLLRAGATDEQLLQQVLGCIQAKGPGHEINSRQFLQPARPMHAIGG